MAQCQGLSFPSLLEFFRLSLPSSYWYKTIYVLYCITTVTSDTKLIDKWVIWRWSKLKKTIKICRDQVRLRGLWLQGWRQGRWFLHWWPDPRLQHQPYQQDHWRGWRPKGEGQEDCHPRGHVPSLQGRQGVQGHRWHPRFRWDLEVVRQERRQDHPPQRSLQAVDQSR